MNTETKRTPEPWIGVLPSIVPCVVPQFVDEQAARKWLESEPTPGNVQILIFPIRRVVACMSACAEISTETLERDRQNVLAKAVTDRDGLVKALQQVARLARDASTDPAEAMRIRSALGEIATKALARAVA